MMNIKNLTPHPITLRDANGQDTTIPPSGIVARVTASPGTLQDIEGIPVPVSTPDTFGDVEGLPEPEKGVAFLVSAIVGAQVKRSDVFTLGTGPKDGAIRNEKGHIVAVTRLKSTI